LIYKMWGNLNLYTVGGGRNIQLRKDLTMKKITSVFIASFILTILFIFWGAIAPENLESVSGAAQNFLQTNFGWFYLISASVILLFVIYLAFSKYGNIKLGKDD